MLDNPPNLTIHRGHRRPAPAMLEGFRGAQTSHLADAMDGRGALGWAIKPLDPLNANFVGPALTAFAYPADIVGLFGALAEAEEGDVIVLANDAYDRTAVIGDLAAGMIRNKGVAGFVTDGLARDKAGIVASRLPVFCRGIVPNSPAMNGPGVVGAPVVLGGVSVCSGDIIVGDPDGVVVIPKDQADAVYARLQQVQRSEEQTERRVREGATMVEGARRFLEHATIIKCSAA